MDYLCGTLMEKIDGCKDTEKRLLKNVLQILTRTNNGGFKKLSY